MPPGPRRPCVPAPRSAPVGIRACCFVSHANRAIGQMHARSNDATFKPVGQNWGQVKRYVRHRRKGAFWLGVFVTSPHRRRQLRSMTAPAAALRAVHLFCWDAETLSELPRILIQLAAGVPTQLEDRET